MIFAPAKIRKLTLLNLAVAWNRSSNLRDYLRTSIAGQWLENLLITYSGCQKGVFSYASIFELNGIALMYASI